MTYDEYIAQQQQAIDEEQQEDSCFLEYQPEGQFVRGTTAAGNRRGTAGR